MFDESEFKQTTIQFRDKSGKIRMIRNIPASYQDAGMILCETDNYFKVYGIEIDSDIMYFDTFAELNLTPGAGIQLVARHRRRASCIESGAGYAMEPEDAFFFGGIKSPEGKKAEYISDTVLRLDLSAAASKVGYADGYICVAGEELDYAAAYDILTEDNAAKFDKYFLDDLFSLIKGTAYEDETEFNKAISSINIPKSNSYLVDIDTTVFDLSEFISDLIIDRPKWSYKWLDCYEHSGCAYSESGTGTQCRWDTSHNVGVWYLSKDVLEYYEKLSTEERDKRIQNVFEHDMAIISDGEIPYRVQECIYDKQTMELIESEGALSGMYPYIDFNSADDLHNMLGISAETKLKYNVIKAKQKNPYPW